MLFALSSGRFVAVGIATALLLVLLLAFVTYSRRARRSDELRRAAERGGEDRKVCPDCASAVPLDVRVCRHCGYRFA
jgi:hypothetical protein